MTRARFTTAYLLLPSFRHLLLIAVRNSNVHHHFILSCSVSGWIDWKWNVEDGWGRSRPALRVVVNEP